MIGCVVAVARDDAHRFSKLLATEITLEEGLGIVGDAHFGVTVQHRSRVAVDSGQPNLRQVHLIQNELFDELRAKQFDVGPGDLGENVTTGGIDLLALPRRTRLHIGATAIIELTGLRNPCAQIERFQPGLLAAVLDKAPNGDLIRKAGVMSIVVCGGTVHSGDTIVVDLPSPPLEQLERV